MPRRPTLTYERRLWRAGHHWVAGLDEVGRGAWAGPVTVGIAVMTPETARRRAPASLRDSKLLTEARREELFDEVAAWCSAWSVGHADAAECDRYGMTAALRLAGLRALSVLRRRMDAMLVDGPRDLLVSQAVVPQFAEALAAIRGPRRPRVVVPVVGGDARCATVAAASVLAKVTRDRHMRRESAHFPAYDFDRNKGYPSPTHRVALQGYGPTSIHRRSWAFTDKLVWR